MKLCTYTYAEPGKSSVTFTALHLPTYLLLLLLGTPNELAFEISEINGKIVRRERKIKICNVRSTINLDFVSRFSPVAAHVMLYFINGLNIISYRYDNVCTKMVTEMHMANRLTRYETLMLYILYYNIYLVCRDEK